MFRAAIMVFIFIVVMFSISLYLVLLADRILDRTLVGVMKNEDIMSTVQGTQLNPSYPTEISFYKK